ncbi:MAG: anthranilate synthase [Bacteroides sp. SM23_62_1]|nr:MAG: anthranilate synthase [Bacteroides sp. SM23_62_1]
MKQINIKTRIKKILADTITPVSIYLRLRDIFPYSLLLESSDYHSREDSHSFICLDPVAYFMVENEKIKTCDLDGSVNVKDVNPGISIPDELNGFINRFRNIDEHSEIKTNGFFGYSTYDVVRYFEDICFRHQQNPDYKIPDMVYCMYRYIIAINHFQNVLYLVENQTDQLTGDLDYVESLLYNRNIATYPFEPKGKEESNLSDEEYMNLVSEGIKHCHRGDVFQIVLSRQFRQSFSGDEFNVYRCLRSINPSPYLFYFDYGSYKIFGSSPEALLQVISGKAYIHPIAGTFKRTGNDEEDKKLALELADDRKENSEHVMLVDLARNDLSRNADHVKVETFREIQFFSHVIHMVSKVSGILPDNYNSIRIMADSFPAGTLSGAPKYKAMQLIDRYENQNRGYYGGGIGYIGFKGDFNHAIMIRSFLSKDNTLFYQAGAGIVADSKEEKELQEVNNKLMALKNAILQAGKI